MTQQQRGHELQAKVHWHVEDLDMRHVGIRPKGPNLNGKGVRFNLPDQLELDYPLDHTDDVDLRATLTAWGGCYRVFRPLFGLTGLTPYATLREKRLS